MSTAQPDSHSPERLVKVQVLQTIEEVNARGPMTADAFERFAAVNGRCELIDGKVHLMSPAGSEHGFIAAQILVALGSHLKSKKIGRVYAAETGFVVSRNPDTVRAPDVAFIRRERLPEVEAQGFGHITPDLVFEVISPSDTPEMIQSKTEMWLAAGVQVVNVFPSTRTVVKHAGADSTEFNIDDTINLSDVVEDWRPTTRELFGSSEEGLD